MLHPFRLAAERSRRRVRLARSDAPQWRLALGRAPGFFTASAFRIRFASALRGGANDIERDAWVLGSSEGTKARDILEGTLGLYASEAIGLWDGLLSDLTTRHDDADGGAHASSSLLITPPSPIAISCRPSRRKPTFSPPPAQAAVAGALAAGRRAGRRRVSVCPAPSDPVRRSRPPSRPCAAPWPRRRGDNRRWRASSPFRAALSPDQHIAKGRQRPGTRRPARDGRGRNRQSHRSLAGLAPPFFRRLEGAAMD